MPNDELSALNFQGEKTMLDLDNIQVVPDFQARDLSDDFDKKQYKALTAEVAEAVTKKVEIEPILVIRIPEGTNRAYDGAPVMSGYYVVEGHRRVAGYKAAGRAKIPAIVRDGTWEDAVDVATSANITNLALPRKAADKREAVRKSLINHFEKSDRWHAEHCKVGHDLVPRLRPEVEKFLRSFAKEPPKNGEVAVRVDKRGRKHKIGAGKKAAPKAVKTIDWELWEGYLSRMTRFVDHVGEVTDTASDKPESPYQKAHTALKAIGKILQRYKASILKKEEDAKAARQAKRTAKQEAHAEPETESPSIEA